MDKNAKQGGSLHHRTRYYFNKTADGGVGIAKNGVRAAAEKEGRAYVAMGRCFSRQFVRRTLITRLAGATSYARSSSKD